MWTPGVRRDDTTLSADPTITVSIRLRSSLVISVSLTAVLMHLDEARRVRLFPRGRIDASVEGPLPDYQVEHSIERSSAEIVLPGVREVDISVDRSREASCLPGVRRLNEMRRNASGVFLPLARRGQSAERAGATPLFGAFGSPGGGPGAGVAPARGTLEQLTQVSARGARESVHDMRLVRARFASRFGALLWWIIGTSYQAPLPIIQSVFPAVRTISRDGRFGIELATIARGAAAGR
jgi:hypothetical protein